MPIDRHTPYTFKNGFKTNNRIVVPPMASQTADENGFVTDRTVEHYKRLTESNAGIIFVEYTFVHESGKSELNQLGADSDAHISGLKKIASTIHQSNALAGLQLVHAGGKTSSGLTHSALMAPSAIPVPVKEENLCTPKPMTDKEIQNWIEWFTAAAGRGVEAGFDVIELHAAHGYGLNQWLSSLTNKRKDFFGRSIEGRSQLLRQIAAKVKEKYPEVLLSIRLPAQDHLDGGLTIEEMHWVVSQLELLGVDLLDVSSGIGGWRRPQQRPGQGYLVEEATRIKSRTDVPVIGVGGIKTGDFIDEILLDAKVDFAAVGRAVLEDPLLWSKTHLD